MTPSEQKAAKAAYKDRKPAWGVFAVICSATGDVWVGGTRNVDTHRNSLWFALRTGSSRTAALQALWREHGEEAFRYEELERLREDYPALGRADELKRRRTLWLDRLQASPLS